MTILYFPTTQIQLLTPAQEQAAADLSLRNWRKLYRLHVAEEIYLERDAAFFQRYLQSKRGQTWGLSLGDRLIGVGVTSSNCIDELWIDENQRCKGFGSALLTTLSEDLGRRGFSSAQVGLEDFNHAARAFFGKRGWALIGSEPLALAPGKRVNALVLGKKLNPASPAAGVQAND